MSASVSLPRPQRGFSLVEILLVLAIIALLSIAAFIIFRQVREASDADTETRALTTIIASVRNLYARTANYDGLTTAMLNRAHIFPRSMNEGIYTPVQPIHHIGGGLMEVVPWDADNRRFAVIYHDMPTSLCVKMAQNYGQNVDDVLVGGVYVKSLGDVQSNPGLVMAECNRSSLVDVTFIQK